MRRPASGHRDEDRRRRQERDPGRREGDVDAAADRPVLGREHSATTVGIVDWNTIAPVMLPIASVSLPWRTQMTELNFSGSSVAMGAIDQREQDLVDAEEWARCSTASTNTVAPRTMHARATSTWTTRSRRRGAGVAAGRAPVEPMEPQRGEVAWRRPRRRPRSALDVAGVDAEEDGGREPLAARRASAAGTRRRPRARSANTKNRMSCGEDAACRRASSSPRRRRRRTTRTADAGHEHRERREHERRAQDRARCRPRPSPPRRRRTGWR